MLPYVLATNLNLILPATPVLISVGFVTERSVIVAFVALATISLGVVNFFDVYG